VMKRRRSPDSSDEDMEMEPRNRSQAFGIAKTAAVKAVRTFEAVVWDDTHCSNLVLNAMSLS
jgi:hypothetical protein